MGEALFDEVFSGSEGLAKSLLGSFGGSGFLITPGERNYDPESGIEDPDEDLSEPVDLAPPAAYALKEIDGSSIVAGDMRTTIPACDVSAAPVPGKSKLLFAGVSWLVVSSNPVSSGSSLSVYELQLRRL